MEKWKIALTTIGTISIGFLLYWTRLYKLVLLILIIATCYFLTNSKKAAKEINQIKKDFKEILPKEKKRMIPEQKPWQTDLDSKKYLIEVHDKGFEKFLGPDFKLAKLDSKERDLIMELLTSGISAIELVPNPEIAERIMEMDFAYIKALAVLKFNVEGNPVLDRFVPMEKEEKEDEEEESGFLNRLAKRLKKEKKVEIE